VRFLWLGALLATVALVAVAPLRMTESLTLRATVTKSAAPAGETGIRQDGFLESIAAALMTARDAAAQPLRTAARLGDGPAGTALATGWMALSAAVLALAAVTILRARRDRRTWPLVEVGDARVRVAPRTGPAVLGILHPEVVVPAWLLTASDEEQRLVVLHEAEHVRARDPLVLAAGCVAAALLPWSPAAWWMLLRLRAAVELDCDARVLRRGVRRREYGTLLIEMAGRGPGLSLGAPALAGSPSTLERRIRAMNLVLPRRARLRAGLFATLGLALLAGACESPLPTTAEVERMDVRALEARTVQLQPAGSGDVTYIVDGREVTAEEARALSADRIARIDVTRAGGAASGTVTIHTRAAGAVAADGSRERVRLNVTQPQGESQTVVMSPSRTFEGLVVIDGQIRDNAALQALDPDAIVTVDIIKGDAATRVYSDPRAAQGVIRVTTRAPAN
jgi:beta-lactamase regulating signal transducer with metallopeptidase domain